MSWLPCSAFRPRSGPPIPIQARSNPLPSNTPPITLDQAEEYAETHRATQRHLSVAVALFVLAPVPLFASIILGQGHQYAPAIGLLPLLAVVAIGVVIAIGVNQRRSAHSRISSYRFASDAAVTAWAEQLERTHQRRRMISLQVAIVLWILAVAPIIFMPILAPDLGGPEMGALFGVALTLLFVATGLLVFLPANWAHEVAAVLTRQHGAVKPGMGENDEASFFGVIAAVYWPLLAAIYLGWSFIGNAWSISWIVWPIGALIFGVLAAGFGAYESYRRAKDSQERS